MANANVPGEGEGFGGAFDVDGAGAGAIADVFDGDESGFGVAVRFVEADNGLVVRCGEASAVEFVAQRGREDGVGLGVGVEIVPDFAFRLFGAGEDGAANLEGVAMAEAGRGLLLDACDIHATADLRVGERAVDERLDERVVVEAEKEMRAARKLDCSALSAPLVEPTQRVETQRVVQLVRAEPLVEHAGQEMLVVERDRLPVGRQVEVKSHE